MANAERWAAGIPNPAYAIDDQTAIKATDGTVKSSPKGTGGYSPLAQKQANRGRRQRLAAFPELGINVTVLTSDSVGRG